MAAVLNRRTFLTTTVGIVAAVTVPEALAGRFRDAVINFVEANYDRSLRDITQDGLRQLVERVLPIENDLVQAASGLREHFDNNWSYIGTDSNQAHTSKCPYCISVARAVEQRAPELAPVPNRTPNCFMINGAQYVASGSGTLHRYQNGNTGPAEGVIWFNSGDYVGRGYNGQTFTAEPNC